ncbi:MAG TPA: hypothetical protein VFD77_08150 [Brumimicrobium sp.]|nr:hypothetical protein [Brumimicrobium sp.]
MNRKILMLAVIGLFAMSCRKDKANWTSDWIVPIVNDSLLIEDYVNDSTFAINPDNSIQVIVDRSLFSLDLKDLIKIPDTSIVQSFSIAFSSLQLTPGFVFIDEVKEHLFSLGEVVLREARIKSGKAKIRIENPIPTKGIFTISLPGVVRDGVEFSYTQIVDGGTMANPGVGYLTLDLTGYLIDMRGTNGTSYNLLMSRMNVKTDPNGPTVTISSQDKFNTKVEFESLVIDYAKGYFGNMVFSDTTIVNVDELNGIMGGAVNINDVNLELIIRNGIKARAQGRISLFESVNYNNTTVGLSHPYFDQALNLNPAQGEWQGLTPSELIFSFNNSSGNMTNFLENLGSRYRIGYAIEINSYGSSSSGNDVIFPQSEVDVRLKADFPLLIGANDLILQDTFAIDFKNDNKLLKVQSGKFILKSTNSFPYGAEIELSLLDENFNSIKKLVTTGKISPAATNSNTNGHVPIEETIEFIVDEEAALGLVDTKHILVRAKFTSTLLNNNTVYANAAFKFLLSSQLKLKASL